MDFSPNLNLPFLLPNQAQKHVTVNETLLALDAVLQISVMSRTETTPPLTPTESSRYIPAASAIGDWAGLEGQIVCFQDGVWRAYTSQPGWVAWLVDEAALIVFNGSNWGAAQSLEQIDGLGIGTTADSINRLAVRSPASLFDYEIADHRLNINKAASTDTASLIFQTDYTGLAEFGLIGDDNFGIKVSTDGTNFISALFVRASDGSIGIGTYSPVSRLHITETDDARLTIDTGNAASGGGFDIINSGASQSWRVTGQADLFKIRDHTAGLDKLMLKAGASGDVLLTNIGKFGVATPAPTATLHVNGTLRIGQFATSALPDPVANGSGAICMVSDAVNGPGIAYSDGTHWRAIKDSAIIV